MNNCIISSTLEQPTTAQQNSTLPDSTIANIDQRLAYIPNVPAEILVEPSAEQWFLARKMGWLFAPKPESKNPFARWYQIFTVVPSTNLTNFSLQYQSYLNDIFHTTWVARTGHAIAMPFIVICMALIARTYTGDTGGIIFQTVLTLWWLIWAFIERDIVWAIALSILSTGIWFASSALAAHNVSPWLPLLGFAALQTLSHTPEPLPPRVNRSHCWLPLWDYLIKCTWGERLKRCKNVVETIIYGFIAETFASPRLVCVIVLEALWAFGHRPQQRAEWKSISRQAIASGNPALDYIGIGGATTLNTHNNYN